MNRAKLLKALEALNTAVAGKPILAEQGCYRIKGKTLRASDGVSLVQAELDEDTGLDCTVPASHLYKLIKGLGNPDVMLTVTEDNKLAVKTDKVRGRYALEAGPGMLDDLDFAVDTWADCPDGLKSGVAKCRFAASKDSSRQVYCGVLVKGDSVLASDGIRIACLKAKVQLSEQPVILSADAAALLDRKATEIKQWGVKGGSVYFKADGVIYGCRNVVGNYTDKVWAFLTKSDTLDKRLTFPAIARDVIVRHMDQMTEVLEMDREVEVKVDGKTMIVHSTDGVRYDLEEELELATPLDVPVQLKAHPACLADILTTTKEMRYADGVIFVAFVTETAAGEFRYLTTVERPKA